MAGDARRDELAKLLDEQANLPSYDAEKFLKDFEAEIYEFAAILSQTIAITNVGKYPWIDPNDLQQELLMRVRHFSINFDPKKVKKKKPSWSKNLWFRLSFYVKDVLRKEDPVGIGYPQRKRYPQWFRLGALDGTQEGEDQSPNGTDFDGSELTEVDAAITVESLEQRQWQSDFDAVGRLAEEIRGDNRIPSMVDCGHGVCRSRKLEWWCKRKGRLKFRGNSLLKWVRSNRKLSLPKSKKCQAHHQTTLNKEIIMSEQEPLNNRTSGAQLSNFLNNPPTNPGIHPSTALVLDTLHNAGSVGANIKAILSATGLSRASVQALILRLRRKGEVYVVAIMGAGKREQYALSKFFPDGPPIQQIYRTNPKKTKPKPKPKKKAAAPAKKTIPKPDQSDIMLIVTALAGVRNAGLKARLLAVLEESMKG